MTQKQIRQTHRNNPEPSKQDGDRRNDDRRKTPGKGFTLISKVGWICRRENKRRK